jgi:methylthioribose-1-phosphate isomerase
MNSLQSLKYSRGKLQVIDQLKLPLELTYIEVNTAEDAWRVIRHMQVRGAPLIACVAVLALAVDVENQRDLFTDIESVSHFLISKMDFLNTSRTTAVNLSTATGELSQLVRNISKAPDADVNSVIDGYIHAAEKMLQDDIATNEAIGDHGAQRILEIVGLRKLNVLTICNTGSLATAGYGTALGVVRSLHSQGLLEQVYACETRPYNQGARLTAFEIVNDGLPGTLITDSMASYLMASKTIDCVIVGADRVAANGDTANKIGTYQLAIVAKYHDIPFFTAVPTTTLDLSLSSGAKIHVEERPAIEMTR